MDCRHCFVADLVEEIVDEGGSRSATRAHESDSSQLVSQQNVAIRVFWSRCQPRLTLGARDFHHGKQRVSPFHRDLFLLPNWSSCCHERNVFGALLLEGKQRVSPFYRDLHLLLKLGSDFHERNVDETLAQNKQRLSARDLHHGKQWVSPFYRGWKLLHEKNVFRFPENGALLFEGKQRVSPFYHDLDLDLSNFWTQFFHPNILKKIFGGSRGDAYAFSYMTSPVSIRTAFGKQ